MTDIKWFVTLDKGKQLVAALLIAVVTLWGSSQYYKEEIERLNTEKSLLQKESHIESLQRTDSFNITAARNLRDCEERTQRFLEQELKKIQDVQFKNSILIKNNAKLIKNK